MINTQLGWPDGADSPLKLVFLTWAALLWSVAATTQGFMNKAPEYNMEFTNPFGNWGSGISLVDYNLDGWPDVTVCRENGPAAIYTQSEGSFVLDPFAPFCSGEGKSIQWVDVDNDKEFELFITQEDGPLLLYNQDEQGDWSNIIESTGLPEFILNASSASWSDVDLDGDLDVYISTYFLDEYGLYMPPTDPDSLLLWNTGLEESFPVVTNKLYLNQGGFLFSDGGAGQEIEDGIKLTLATLFHDVDQDGWPDLLVANDKFFANSYYRNLGNGTFEDLSETSGFNLVLDAMTLTEGDFNRDGMRDILITNTPESTDIVLTYDPEYHIFTDVTSIYFGGLLENSWTWGARFMDMENDGDLDVYIAEHHPYSPYILNHLYRNDGLNSNYHFSIPSINVFPLDFTNAHAVASADWNRDGMIDFAVNNVGNHKIRMWENQFETEGNWLEVNLSGTVSNTFAVGTWVDIYLASSEIPLRQFTALGSDYLSQSEFTLHFGLGDDAVIDSLVIQWPLGLIETWENISVNNLHDFVEGTAVLQNASVTLSAPLCYESQSELVAIIPESVSFQWSDGETSNPREISEGGWYSYAWTNEYWEIHDSIFVEESWNDSLDWIWTPPICADGSLGTLHAEAFDANQTLLDLTSYTFVLNEDTVLFPTFIESGAYQVAYTHANGCENGTLLDLAGPSPILWNGQNADSTGLDTLAFCSTDSMLWEATLTGGSPPYDFIMSEGLAIFSDENSLLLTALDIGPQSLTILDETGCEAQLAWFVQVLDSIVFEFNTTWDPFLSEGSITFLLPTNPDLYTISWYLWSELTENWEGLSNLSGSNAEGLAAGEYWVIWEDQWGCFGEVFIPLNSSTAAGNGNNEPPPLRIKTDSNGYTILAPESGSWQLFDANGKKIRTYPKSQAIQLNFDESWPPIVCVSWNGAYDSSQVLLNFP